MKVYRMGSGSMSWFRWTACFVMAESAELASAVWARVHPEAPWVPYEWSAPIPPTINGVKPEVFS